MGFADNTMVLTLNLADKFAEARLSFLELPTKLRTNGLFFRILYPLDKNQKPGCCWVNVFTFSFLENLILTAFICRKILNNHISALIIGNQCLIV